MHWKHKATIQNWVGKLPPRLGNPIYYHLQCRFGGLRQPTPLSRLHAGIELVRRLHQFDRSAGSAVFLEVGTGHQLALPLSLWLCGASEITTVDLNRYLKESLVFKDLEYLRRHEEAVRNLFRGIAPSGLFEERFERLMSGANSLRDLLLLANIRYRAPADASRLALEASSVDYHISFTVLEHIPAGVVERIFREGRRLLKPDGLFVHYIDFSDHFAHSDDAISSVNFLQFSESEWEDLAGNRYMFHNRLRVDEFKNLLLGLPLQILALDSEVDARAVDLLQKGFPLHERFRNKDSRTNAATGAWLVASPAPAGSSICVSGERKMPEETADRGGRAALGFGVSTKRLYDLFFSGCGLFVLSPLFLLLAALIKMADGGNIFYRQVRIGLHGRPFRICKFRTMVSKADQLGPSVTKDGDARITWIGRILRKTKLDELPQLWNVLRGEMSLVGPRPEVPRYVQHYTPEQREILRFKPGITDLASLCFRDEEALLGHADNVETFYIEQCLPRKLRLNREYAERANLWSDTWIIGQTLCPYWIGVLATYGIILVASSWLSFQLVYDFAPPALSAPASARDLSVLLALQLACLTWRKQCRGLLSYFSFPELRQVGAALALAAAELLALRAAGASGLPRNVILVNALLSVSLLSGFRALLRVWRERSSAEEDAPADPPMRVAIIGAGRTGAKLALELMLNKEFGRIVVAFFDDDFQKWQKRIHEVPVVGMPECLLEGWAERLDEVVIAMPGAPPDRIREIDRLLRQTRLKFYTASCPTQFWNQPQMG